MTDPPTRSEGIDTADRSTERWSVIDVARLLQLSDGHAASQLAGAADLVETLPLTVRALTEGRIGLRSAEAILETSKTLRPDLHADLERGVLPRAEQQTVPGLRRSLRRAAIRLDADAAEQRRRSAVADRHVRRASLPDGMAQLTALLSAADVEAVWNRLDNATTLFPPSDTRTVDQQRADLFVDAMLSGIAHDALPELQGRRPTVGVVIGLSTLLGLDDEPGELDGHGAITAQAAREIAADASATWRRFVTDPVTGHLLDFGSTVYRPPQQLRDFIVNRSPRCVHPGCGRLAYRAQLDHRTPHDAHGPTSARNIFPLCVRHHQAKTHHRWRYHRDHNDEIHWTSPGGRQYANDDTPRWRMPSEQPVPAAPSSSSWSVEERSASHDERTAAHAERDAQRQRERTDQPNDHHTAQPGDTHRSDDGPTVDDPTSGDERGPVANSSAVSSEANPGNGDPALERAAQRLADYLQSLPPDVPPF